MTVQLHTSEEVFEDFENRFGDIDHHGWRVRMRHAFGYVCTDQWYQSVVGDLVDDGCRWLDVGGGTSILPHCESLARELSDRSATLVAVDPDDGVHDNQFAHRTVQCRIEDFVSHEPFDLATLRMVAEHIPAPDRALASLRELVRPGGRVVVYTPHRWAPVSVMASIIPDPLHASFTGFLWKTHEEDVFPTVYRMNTRGRLRELFSNHGFEELAFWHLPNCSVGQRFAASHFVELLGWKALSTLRVPYPENDLLGVYGRA